MKRNKMVYRLILGAAFLIVASLLKEKGNIALVLYLLSYLIIGGDIVKKAARNIVKGHIFDENFLMSVATVGALLIGDYPEAVAVMLFYQVGELFSSYAVEKSRKSITELMDINPEFANVIRNNIEEKVEPDDVRVGEIIVVKPGERVPLDGIVLKGSGSLDTKALTGESMPRDIEIGEEIISGCINLSGVLEVQVTKEFDDSTITKILELVENASSRKAKAENFITKFARYYTPIVVGIAVLLAIIPPLLGSFTTLPFDSDWSIWIYRACSFLVVSCPCALVISVPLSFFGGLGAASKQGILMKGSNYLEALGQLEIVVFDKTGTLTTGKFAVTQVNPRVGTEEELLQLAAYGEYYSNHPIALSIKEAYGKSISKDRLGEVEEISGRGVRAQVNNKQIYIGNEKWMQQQGIEIETIPQTVGTILYISDDSAYLGNIVISDQIRQDTPAALKGLKKIGVRQLIMLTGDKKEVGEAVGRTLGLDHVYAELLPGDKVSQVERLLGTTSEKGTLGFVGDGINDAPVLARADVGIAMGGIGSDAAVEAADVVIMTDEPSKLITAISISRKTMTIVRQNIVFALGVKIVVLILTAFGYTSMWAAVFSDVGVSVLAILNAIRALKIQK